MSDSSSNLLSRWGFRWEGLRDNRNGEWWLLAQAVLILAHLLPPIPPPSALGLAWPLGLRLLGWGLFAFGVALAGQAALHLGASLTPLPEPMQGVPLVTSGAYSRCRHPLYQAVVLCSLGVTLALGSLLHLALWLALSAVLNGKAHREERRLLELHPDYTAYRHTTPAILPRVPGLDWR